MDKPELGPTMIIDEDIFKQKRPKLAVDKKKIKKGNKKGAFFYVTAGPDMGDVIFLDRPDMIIGRDSNADIVFKKGRVSRSHAQVITAYNKVAIIDIGSTNGTFVNDKRITRQILSDEDEVRIGEVVLKFFREDLDAQPADTSASTRKSGEGSAYYQRVFKECKAYFKEKTDMFLNRQITAHLRKTPETIDYSDSKELVKWVGISASLLLNETHSQELAQKIKAIKK